MAKFGRNAPPAYKKAVLKAQFGRLKATETMTLKEVQDDYIKNMWPADRKLVFPNYKSKPLSSPR